MQKALPLDRGHRLHVHKTIGNIHKTFICSTYVLCPGVYGAFTVNFKYVQQEIWHVNLAFFICELENFGNVLVLSL